MDEAVTIKEMPAVQVPTHEVFHQGKPTGVKGCSYSTTLELGVQVMKLNPTWKQVEVRDLKGKKCGGVWRNPLEGRLIKSKELG